MLPDMLDLASLRSLYAGGLPLAAAMEAVADRMASADPAVFITAVGRDALRQAGEDLLARAPEPNSLPLWGMPFAVKDNIDVAGLPTTAACPAFTHTPVRDAVAVARLKAAGAIVTGKVNLDQFATGLNGTRSPFGAPRCVFNADYISGGSSSGSAVAVAAGLAAFALGTDTAGSGRVPAAFNNIVGIKPTPGRLSGTGLLPACRTLDTITVFAGCVADGLAVRRIAEAFDPDDAFSRLTTAPDWSARPRIGVLGPEDRAFYDDHASQALYEAAVARLSALGAEAVSFDFAPFREAAALLYDGPWVAERLAALEPFLATNPGDFDPHVRAIVEGARRFNAVDAFRARYALEALRCRTQQTWERCDALLIPTAPTIYTVEQMRAEPIRLNSNLGHYTNFANLLGLAAIAVPAGFRSDGLPFGVTLVGRGGSDDALGPLADALHQAVGTGMGRAKVPAPVLPPRGNAKGRAHRTRRGRRPPLRAAAQRRTPGARRSPAARGTHRLRLPPVRPARHDAGETGPRARPRLRRAGHRRGSLGAGARRLRALRRGHSRAPGYRPHHSARRHRAQWLPVRGVGDRRRRRDQRIGRLARLSPAGGEALIPDLGASASGLTDASGTMT